MSRNLAITNAEKYFDGGSFQTDLARRVAYRTESQDKGKQSELFRYLNDELCRSLEKMDFHCEIFPNPREGGGPFLVARRHEGDALPTVMTYGHGDVVPGTADQWSAGLDPWVLTQRGDRWYGRGTADNKGQHTINFAALNGVLEARGSLGFNMVALIETGEECGSPGLKEFCDQHRHLFKADVFIASDGPRLQPDLATIFLGSRGVFNFTMTVNLRDGGHHSGNWGGLLANPGVVLANAIASVIDAKGKILVEGWKPGPIPDSVRLAISKLKVGGGSDGPQIDPDWGEPGLTAEEKVFGSNTFEIRAFETGSPQSPMNAIPPHAVAHGHLRFVVGTDPEQILPVLRDHLDARGFSNVTIEKDGDIMYATRLDPDNPWVRQVTRSIETTTGAPATILPNLGGSLPNDVFTDVLGLPAIWIPHSYAGCSQHAPDEHVLAPVCRDALRIMAGVWWDLAKSFD